MTQRLNANWFSSSSSSSSEIYTFTHLPHIYHWQKKKEWMNKCEKKKRGWWRRWLDEQLRRLQSLSPDQIRVRRRRKVMLDLFVKVCVYVQNYIQEGTKNEEGKKKKRRKRPFTRDKSPHWRESHRSIVMFEHHHHHTYIYTHTDGY